MPSSPSRPEPKHSSHKPNTPVAVEASTQLSIAEATQLESELELDHLELVPVPDATTRCTPRSAENTAASSVGIVVASSESSGPVEAVALVLASGVIVAAAVGFEVALASHPEPKKACLIGAWADAVDPPGAAELASEESVTVTFAFMAFEVADSASEVSSFAVASPAGVGVAASAEETAGGSQRSIDHHLGQEYTRSFFLRYLETRQT
ncbi:hypothetical protein BKA70DRAFT_1442650 [Coprinopsis sp. MPI-PUGE-AT-0042]|nr:hypothetical protein BKA70DRAFT_1442650 [Coprinopsis sp. MPI-PUGE-AT-0042]